jgi:membrane fusion protein (multidrug efflux system)
MSLTTLIAVLSFLCVAGCSPGAGSADQAPTEEAPRNVRVLELEPVDLEQYLTVTGPLRPIQGTDLSAEESGVVQEIPHDKGSRVAQGTVVVLLDRDLLAAQLESARADREMKAYNEERTRALYEENSVSKQEMLQAHTLLAQAEAEEEIARLRHARAAVKAPFTGIVTERWVEPGELVTPGQRVARLVDPFTLELEGGITEREVAWIEMGAPALITVDGEPGVAQGKVHWIGFEAAPATGKFPVEVRMDNHDLRYRAGVVARARILERVHREVVAIPRGAVLQRPGREVAFVVEDGRAVERELRLGPGQGLMVMVEDGLAIGDQLVVRGQRDLRDGARVVVQERATAPDGSLPTDPDVVRQEANASDLRGGTRSLESDR